MDWPKISVVIPIRNEATFIARTVEYLQKQDYPTDRLEILVVDGESDDQSASIVEQIAAADPRVKLLTNPKRLSSAARNIGAQAATGEIVVYVDGHTYIDNDQLLKNTALLMAEKEVSVLSRPQFLETPENNEFQKAVALARRSKLGHGLDSTIYSEEDMYVNPSSAGASYKKELFEKVGYFDERFDASEDYEFNYRCSLNGFQAFSSLKLAVYYYPRDSLASLFKQMSRYGTGRMRLAQKHPGTLGIGTLIPVMFALGLMMWPLISLISSAISNLFYMAYGIYTLAVLGSSALIAFRNGANYFMLCPPIYLFVHFGLGWGFIAEFFRSLTGKGVDFSRERGQP